MTNGDRIQTGDVSGSGIFIGKNIHIGGDVVIRLANEARGLGLNLLKPTYFEEYKATDQDFEDWKEGFSFKLSSIKEHYEFRRSVVDQIKMKIENHHQLLLVGEMGTSKSTILMEIICEYFEKGFKVLYNFGDSDITNGTEIIHFIENLLNNNNNVLVAVDDVHSERTAAIFYVMDELSNYESHANVRFLLTAGLPEFDWYVNDRLGKVKEGIYRESIRKFRARPAFRFELPLYSKEEIKTFIKRYGKIDHLIQKIRNPLNVWSKEYVYQLISENIYNDTAKGHPLMVKFSVFGKGLRSDVERRYENYLRDPEQSEEAFAMKMTTMLVCSLLEITGLPISEELLEDMDLLNYAVDLEGATLYYQPVIGWKTIHPKWDIELLSYLYDPNDKRKLLKNKEYIKKAVGLILKLKDKEELVASVIETLYTIPLICSVSLHLIEDIVKEIPDYLSDDKKASFSV